MVEISCTSQWNHHAKSKWKILEFHSLTMTAFTKTSRWDQPKKHEGFYEGFFFFLNRSQDTFIILTLVRIQNRKHGKQQLCATWHPLKSSLKQRLWAWRVFKSAMSAFQAPAGTKEKGWTSSPLTEFCSQLWYTAFIACRIGDTVNKSLVTCPEPISCVPSKPLSMNENLHK